MNDPLVDNLERTVNLLLLRLATLEAEVARLAQMQWQLAGTPAGGGGGSFVQVANGTGIPAKASGVLGSASYTLYTLNSGTGTLTAGSTVTVWNDAPNAVATGDIYVGQDASGNYYAITEFC
jgi:hypothetical protein